MSDSFSNNWFDSIYRPLRGNFREVVIISLFVNMLALALPVFILQVYDRVVMHNGISTLYALVYGVLIALGFDFLLRQTRSRLLQWAAVRVDGQLGARVYDKIMALPLALLERKSASDWQVLFRDVDVVRNTICGPTAVLAVDLPFAVLFLGLVYVIAAPVAWVLLVAVPCFLLLTWRSGRVIEHATRDERQTLISRDALISEMLSARGTIKALALENSFRPKWENSHANGIEQSLVRGEQGDKFTNTGIGLAAATTVALTAVGALAILNQEMTIGALIAANMISNRIISPLNQLVGSWRSYAQYKQSIKRLDELFVLPEDSRLGGMELDRPNGAITLENVSYTYDQNRPPVLDKIDISIETGVGLVGIVGANGSGKTTLLKLIRGLYRPVSGRVLLDGADISQFSNRQLAQWIGYVPQEQRLFKGTIRENIAITRPDVSDKEVIAAAKLSGVHAYVTDLPDGYETEVGEGGSRLSGGERQRIAIARALIGNPPILILDEPTSHLDLPAQKTIAECLMTLAKERTVVLVSHRPSLLTKCDYLIVLDHGTIRLSGDAGKVLPWLKGRSQTQNTSADQGPQSRGTLS